MRCGPTRKSEIFELFVVPSEDVEMREAEDVTLYSKTSFHLLLLLLLLLENRVLRKTRTLSSFVGREIFPEIAGFHQGVL